MYKPDTKPNSFPFFPSINRAVYSASDIFSSSYLMPEYRWKVTLLSEGMLIQNCQQLFWRNPWLLWSLHPTECPNFDTESHGCSYLYILWENRFPPCNRVFSFCFLCSQAIPYHSIVSTFVHTIKRLRKRSCLSRQYVLFYVVVLAVVVRRRRLRYSKVPGSQSASPNQCISYNSHSLLILPLKFMLLFSATPYCGPPCLPPQEGHSDTRVLCQMPSDSLRRTSTSKSHIHRHCRTISRDLVGMLHS